MFDNFQLESSIAWLSYQRLVGALDWMSDHSDNASNPTK